MSGLGALGRAGGAGVGPFCTFPVCHMRTQDFFPLKGTILEAEMSSVQTLKNHRADLLLLASRAMRNEFLLIVNCLLLGILLQHTACDRSS